jgi:hypothetical protein
MSNRSLKELGWPRITAGKERVLRRELCFNWEAWRLHRLSKELRGEPQLGWRAPQRKPLPDEVRRKVGAQGMGFIS